MQAKLHHWAAADPGRRFDDLFNFVYDPATLIVAFDRVAGNPGEHSRVDGLTVAYVEASVGMPGFLSDLRAQLKTGSFRPLPVRERRFPNPVAAVRSEVFTVKLPVPLITRVRTHAAASGRTLSAVVAQALEEFLARAHRERPRR